MKKTPIQGIFPWFTIVAGVVGFVLQCWLFSSADRNDLFPRFHFAGIASFVLLAITVAICYLATRNMPSTCPDDLFAAAPAASVGIILSALGFAISAFTVPSVGFLSILTQAVGVLAAMAMVYVALQRAKGLPISTLFHCGLVVYLILRTMTCCSNWSAEPQLLRYFFPLISCVFLMLTAYSRAALPLEKAHCRQYAFFSQVALFCCCISLWGSDWLFYLSAIIWILTDCPVPRAAGKYAK